MAWNILIVDDSATVRAVIVKTLKLAGIEYKELYQAANGREALDVLGRDWIDLVLCDVSMPVMDGEELVATMRRNGLIATVPVIMVSSAGSRPLIERLLASGVRAFVKKPFTPEHVREVVDEVMGATSHDA